MHMTNWLLAPIGKQVFPKLAERILIIDLGFKVICTNMACAHMYSERSHCHEVCYGRHEPCSDCAVSNILKSREPSIRKAVLGQDDGNDLWVEIKTWPIFDAENNVGHIAELFRDITPIELMKKALKEKEEKARALGEAHAAIKTFLDYKNNKTKNFQKEIADNVQHLVMPHINALKTILTGQLEREYLGLIESNLAEIVSPFPLKLLNHSKFTPREVQIADLIRKGKTTKEIAVLFGLSTSAIELHRFNLRKKLGLIGKKANLASHLNSLD